MQLLDSPCRRCKIKQWDLFITEKFDKKSQQELIELWKENQDELG